jgi:hypothetical protein
LMMLAGDTSPYCTKNHDVKFCNLLIVAASQCTTGAAVRVSDSPAVSRTRTKPTVKVEVEEMDDLASSMGASTLGQ